MYYVFQPAIKYWRNQVIRAVIQGNFPETKPHWWAAVPLTEAPPPMTFATNSKAPKPDNLFASLTFELFSSRLIEIMQNAAVLYETFPIRMIDTKTREELPLDYRVFHLLELYPAIDRSKSVTDEYCGNIEKIVLTEESLKARKPLFREANSSLVFIHEDLKKLLEATNVTGCSYIPVEEHQVGNEVSRFSRPKTIIT